MLAAMASLVIVVIISQFSHIWSESAEPAMWIMAALGALAGTQAFIGVPSSAGPVIVCPTICFTFAVLLCWGLGPAVVAQCLAVAVVAWRLRRSVREAIAALAQYTLAFVAAEGVLWWGKPDPLHHHLPIQITTDALTIIGAVLVWLLVYGLCEYAFARMNGTTIEMLRASGTLKNTILFKAALVMLAPILAVAAHINIGFVAFVFLPLYAVQRMAQLATQRERAARVDPLTGLSNRAGLKLAFAQFTGPRRPIGRRVTLLLADLDEFKHVNDALGHDVGDRLLVAVARRLARVPLGDGEIARLGGDEFGFIALTGSAIQARELADAVVRALSEPISLDGLQVDVTASVGIAIHTDGEDFPTLMRHADIAMYDAKQRGDDIATYESGAHQDSLERLALLADFRRALEDPRNDSIEMHYQPQVSLATGHIEGVEALLRWRHPKRGLVNTQDLINLAERSSVMHLLTMRVIDDVIAQVAAWAEVGIRLRTSMNVSSRDLYGNDIVARLAARLTEYRVEPTQIQIEITESALLRDPSRVTGTVGRICALGVSVALDDFGTGYSSLQHLRRLPISEIKIDRSFVGAMANNHDDAAIVRSTVEMARALGIRTVAEGVETEYTRQMLAEAGCTLAQGWLTAHPMPASEIVRWMEGRTIAANVYAPVEAR
jgi:diguanylate cyclase